MDLLLFLFSFTYLALSFAQQASIIVLPKSVNIAVNGTANFTCTAVAAEIEWEVNGQPVDDHLRSRGFNDDAVPLIILNATQNLHTRTLSAFGSADNNGSNITCSAIFTSPFSIMKSKPAVLLVFEPGPVSNLTVVSINSTTVLISWSPPFTLEGVPILGYNVTITETFGEENEILESENTTMLNYTFSIDDPDPDSNFTVTVIPIYKTEDHPETTIAFMFSYILVSSSSAPMSISTMTSVMTATTTTDSIGSTNNLATSSTMMLTASFTPTSTPLPLPIIIASIGAFILLLIMISITLLLILCCCLVKSKKEKNHLTVEVVSLTEISSMQSSSLVIATKSPLVLDEESPQYATLDTFSHLVPIAVTSAAPITVEEPVECTCAVDDSSHHEKSEEEDGFTIISTPPTCSAESHQAISTEESHQAISTEESHQAISTEESHQAISTEEALQAISTEESHQATSTEESHQATSTEESYQAVSTESYQLQLEEYVIVPSDTVTEDVAEITSTQTQYAELDFCKKRPKAVLAPETVVYATVSPQERTYANAGEQKRLASLYGIPTDDEREEIVYTTKHKWRLIGLQLGVHAEYLDTITMEHSDDPVQCCSTLFKRWAHNELPGSDLQPFMWLSVINILDGSLVRETNLARKIENKINIDLHVVCF